MIPGGGARNFIAPISDVSIDHDSWDVSGLKGTGSKAATLKEVFVSNYRIHELVDTYNDVSPGLEVNDRPLYWMSFLGIFNSTATNTVIGTAMCGVSTFIEQSRVRLIRGSDMGWRIVIAAHPILYG